MSKTTPIENTRNPVDLRSVIIIEDDSETEGQGRQTAQGSRRGSISSMNGLANGISTSKLDVDPPRTPTTTGGELPNSASTSPTPRPNALANTHVDPSGDALMMQDPSQKSRVSTTGPKQTKPKEDSPVPQLPPRPPQQPTVRLEFFIDDPEEYEVNILEFAKGAGQRLPTPPPPEKDSSESEDEDEPPEPHPLPMPDVMADAPAPTLRRRKRRNRDYDLDDPFIDDIELAIDERTHIAQTALQGFYVSAGEVDLVAQSSPPPASKRGPGRPPKRAAGPVNATLIARTLLSNPLGDLRLEGITAHAAISASLELGNSLHSPGSPVLAIHDLDMANGNERKRKASPDSDDPKKKRKTDMQPFHPDLETALAGLQQAVSKHDFTYKGKFPPDLKPLLLETAIKAICLGDYNESFFNYLPKIFPYNRFTMFKLTKRLVYKDHIRLIHERQTALLEELGKQVNEGMESAKSEYERNMMLWEERRAKKKADESLVKAGNGMEGVELTSSAPPPPMAMAAAPIPDEHKDHEGEGDEGEDDKDKPPTTRYRLNETMRGYLWALVQLSNEVCILTNEKNGLENSKELVSEQSQRKELYKKIMQAFPDGWMNTGTISREVSMMKKKMETATAPKTEDGSAPILQPNQPIMSVMPSTSTGPS